MNISVTIQSDEKGYFDRECPISLVWISHLFLSLFLTVEYLSRVLLMQDWLDFLREQYEETEKQLFGELDGNTNENK